MKLGKYRPEGEREGGDGKRGKNEGRLLRLMGGVLW